MKTLLFFFQSEGLHFQFLSIYENIGILAGGVWAVGCGGRVKGWELFKEKKKAKIKKAVKQHFLETVKGNIGFILWPV